MNFDLQNTFYTLGIVFMTLMIVITLGIGFLVFYIFKKVTEIQKQVEEKIETVSRYVDHPAEMASEVGGALAAGAMKGISKLISKKKE